MQEWQGEAQWIGQISPRHGSDPANWGKIRALPDGNRFGTAAPRGASPTKSAISYPGHAPAESHYDRAYQYPT